MSFSTNWRDYEYVVRWVQEMRDWAEKHQIHEFIAADEAGNDPTGRITDANAPGIDSNLVWTVYSSEEKVIEAGVKVGTGMNWYVYGWYVGQVPHSGSEVFDEMKYLCQICEGKMSYLVDEDGDEELVDCEVCIVNPHIEVIHLQDTDFSLPALG